MAGTSFRTVAAQANVPLGSMTYHFCSMQELLAAGFERFVEQSLARLEGRLRSTREPHEAIGALLTLVHEDATSDPPKHLAVSRELQALCVREPAFRTVAKTWFEGSARILQRHFDPLTAQVLPPLLDGLAFFWDYMAEGDTTASDIVAKLLPAPLPRGTCAPANDISPGW
ncbi:TetR family transcriptional regulator [Arthrobacter sp. GN70]|nr:TetR family transcriptional regulator [Arthrobacter sp. GN70]